MNGAPVGVRLMGCGKTFGGSTVALRPCDLDIAAGETLVLLGPSGCGKTTLLRIVAGLEQPDPGGRVLFDDAEVTALPIEKRGVGMVFQSYALFPNMTVLENVAYGLKIRGERRAQREAHAREFLALCRIDELAARRIDQLSGGQRQRVALARAVAVRPRLLLLDEPLTALDAALRESLRDELAALLRRLGITSVYVTHDQTEAMTLADRIVVMRNGGIAQIGAPQDIYFRPADRFVAGFVGTTNRLRGRAVGDHFECAGGVLPLPPDAVRAAPTEIHFRPESVMLSQAADSPDGRGPASHSPIKARLVSCAFLGASRRAVAAVGDDLITIDLPNTLNPAPGTEVGLSIAPESILLLDPE